MFLRKQFQETQQFHLNDSSILLSIFIEVLTKCPLISISLWHSHVIHYLKIDIKYVITSYIHKKKLMENCHENCYFHNVHTIIPGCILFS